MPKTHIFFPSALLYILVHIYSSATYHIYVYSATLSHPFHIFLSPGNIFLLRTFLSNSALRARLLSHTIYQFFLQNPPIVAISQIKNFTYSHHIPLQNFFSISFQSHANDPGNPHHQRENCRRNPPSHFPPHAKSITDLTLSPSNFHLLFTSTRDQPFINKSYYHSKTQSKICPLHPASVVNLILKSPIIKTSFEPSTVMTFLKRHIPITPI